MGGTREGTTKGCEQRQDDKNKNKTYITSGAVTMVMRQAPTMRASEQFEAAWDREVGVPPGVRTDSETGSSSHTGLAM